MLSLFSIALLTGAKTSNVFLLLPYGIMFASVLFRGRFAFGTIAAAILPCALVSFLPIATLCYIHTGDIAGDPGNVSGFKAVDKPRVLAANLAMMTEDITTLPLNLPIKKQLDRFDTWWNATSWSQSLTKGHPYYQGLHHPDFPYEGVSGLGSAVTVLLVLMAMLHLPFVATKYRPYPDWVFALVAVSAWFAFLISFSLLSINSLHRITAPYYPLLIATLPWLWIRGPWDKSRWIYGCALLVLLSSIFLVLTAPIRPVLPMISVLRYASDTRHIPAAQELLVKYEFWTNLRDNLKEIRTALPQDDEPIGFIGAYRETSYGLWKPLGTRKLYELATPDPRDLERDKNVHQAVVTEAAIQQKFGMSLEQWLQRYNVQVKQVFEVSLNLSTKEAAPPCKYYLVTWR